MNDPIVERLIIRENGICYDKEIDLKNVSLTDAVVVLDDYCKNKGNDQARKIWTCRLGWHNFKDLNNHTVCSGCGLTVMEVKKERKGGIQVKNIILHIKMNVRRWRDEQLLMIQEIINKEVDRRTANQEKERNVAQGTPKQAGV